MEAFDGVGTGKYVKGLEQERMAFCDDREDIYSMALSSVHSLLEKYNIPFDAIGRLEVGTETVIDKSKSVKTVLMQLFEEHGNNDIEGVDTINACYGGTNALFNAVNWVESSSWDGRYALVVAGDIAVYEAGPARPTGGAGVVAMLVGRDAPIVFEGGIRGSYMEHAYDFYKPNLESEYPIVDGKLSVQCYYRALDNCYRVYAKKFEQVLGTPFHLDHAQHALYHSPYTKLVRRSFARTTYNDYLSQPNDAKFAAIPKRLSTLDAETSYVDRELQTVFDDFTAQEYDRKVGPALLLPKNLGNSYTGSLYASLNSLVFNKGTQLAGNRVMMFSYGSGLAATLFSLRINNDSASVAMLADMQKKSDLDRRLASRISCSADEFSATLKLREGTHSAPDYSPQGDIGLLSPNAYYLTKIDNLKRREYARRGPHN